MNDHPNELLVRIRSGSIHLTREVADRYFADIAAVGLIAFDGSIQIFPLVGETAGGHLLKVLNLHGDRVINAQDLFRSNQFSESPYPVDCAAEWNAERSALIIHSIPLQDV